MLTHLAVEPGREKRRSYIVHLASFPFVSVGTCDTSETGEEPFGHGVDGVDSRFVGIEPRPARSDVEPQKVFDGGEIGRSDSTIKTLVAGCLFVGRG
jgi:hypothetical protein